MILVQNRRCQFIIWKDTSNERNYYFVTFYIFSKQNWNLLFSKCIDLFMRPVTFCRVVLINFVSDYMGRIK